ncbi:MAG: ribonuclease [Flavipsychrobacter sp.]|nr:ribonuclease [Flavipsychrobacter sp.]
MLKRFFKKGLIEAGCDEAGRGCLAGPVFAASVILPANFRHPLLNDSKQVTEEDRNKLRPIIERKAVAWAVAMVDHTEIDRINILKASFKAMHMAIDQLTTRPDLLLIDGHIFSPYFGIVHQCVVQGDATYASIAAASILAKTHRDEYMLRLHEEYPHYGWNENKGYGTAHHRKYIKEAGISPYHRKTFGICNEFAEGKETAGIPAFTPL